MPISSRVSRTRPTLFAAALCCTIVPAHAQSTAQKAPAKVAPKAAPAKTSPARTTAQSEVSPLPAPDVEFASPVIVPARAATPLQAAPTVPATGEIAGDLAQFLSGKLVPLDIKLSEMKSGWQSLRVVRADEKTETAPNALAMRKDFFQQLMLRFGSANQRYFTQGHTLRFNNDTHLVVYRAQFPNEQSMNEYFEAHAPKPNAQQMDAASILRLVREFLDTVPVRASLLNTRNISAMEDVTTFNFDIQFASFTELFNAEMKRSEELHNKSVAAASGAPAIESNLKQLFEGVNQYTQDYDEKLPPLQDLASTRKAIDPYVRNKEIWMDSLKITLHPNALLSGKPLAHLKPYASSMVLFYSDADAQGERWILRLDGEVRRINAAQWPQLKIASRIP